MSDIDPAVEQMKKEVAYYKRKLDELAGANLKLDYSVSALQHDLKQKRQGFAVLVELQRSITIDTPISTVFERTLGAVNATLEMDRSAVLTTASLTMGPQSAQNPGAPRAPERGDLAYRVSHALGVPEPIERLAERDFLATPELLDRDGALLGNGAAERTPLLDALREALGLPFLICLPILLPGEPGALLVAGRLAERPPFRPRLDDTDVATLRAISSLIHASQQNKRTAMVELANTVLAEKNEQLSQTLQRLKDTQKQLVAQEKLASLGALTAGIAHEIKNPLNFVNNFSDLSVGLIDDLLSLLSPLRDRLGGELSEIEEIAADLRINAAKIHEHGKRANSIVQGMLEHARHGTGEAEESDLNALVRHHAGLAIQWYSAANPGAEQALSIDCDPALPTVRIVPQELGQVFLNLIGNACWAVNTSKKRAEAGYAPAVRATTRAFDDRVEIRIIDNGDGIPAAHREKIFTPFFTTKPTGQGTGLGLSISHEIVRGNGGSIAFETEEGRGTELIVTLPRRRD